MVAPVAERILNSKELRALVPYSIVHIDRLEKAGKFPRRIKLGEHRIGWKLSEIMAWIEARPRAELKGGKELQAA